MEISQPTVKCVETNEDKSYGKYTIAPLERGFGITLGNSLRRVLLSSLSGAAVTSIKIEKIKHEFSTVPGIIEDMTEIILNIKGIRAKLHNEVSALSFTTSPTSSASASLRVEPASSQLVTSFTDPK